MIDELRLLIEVVKAGSLSKAARYRNVAVSSVTRKIDHLETEMGVKLLRRNSRSMILTDAGQQFLDTARHIVTEIDNAKAVLIDSQSDPQGLLTVTAPTSFGRLHVLPAVTRFLSLYPQIEIDLNLSDYVIDLSEQRIDVAIRIGTLPDSDLIATKLAPFRRLACASPDYLRRHGTPARPEELLKHNCLTVASMPALSGSWCFSGVNRGAVLPVNGNFRSNDIETLLKAALDGLGVVHLASWLVCDKIISGELIQLFPEFVSDTNIGIHAVRLPGRSHTLRAKLFIEHLKQEFGSPAYWDKAIVTQ